MSEYTRNTNCIEHLFFGEDGEQNITCLDGVTLVFAREQRYIFQPADVQEGDETFTQEIVTIPALVSVDDGMECVRQYLRDKGFIVDWRASAALGMTELMYRDEPDAAA